MTRWPTDLAIKPPPPRWLAVCESNPISDPETDSIWTLSLDPEFTGWETDGGTDGYGLSRADARFLAACANYVTVRGLQHELDSDDLQTDTTRSGRRKD